MISAIQWIRQGAAAQNPEKFKFDEKEFERISKITTDRLGDAKVDLNAAQQAAAMDVDSDSEGEEQDNNIKDDMQVNPNDQVNVDEEQPEGAAAGSFLNRKDLAYYDNPDEDPYITLKHDEQEEAEEREELQVLATDNLLLAAKTEDDVSQLEVYVYERSEENLYVHHDIMLPSFPLCLEWLDFHCGEKAGQEGHGNYVAVGTFEPDIEIWNLDVVDAMIPQTILGQQPGAAKPKKRSKKPNANYHVDAIMDMSWNKQHRNFLLSSSADATVKLWDLTNSTCVQSYSHHKDKVQAVAWNPVEATAFITGSYDKTISVLDARAPEKATAWKLQSDVESLVWDPHNATNFYAATEDGIIQYFDVRQANGAAGGKPLFTLQAHDGAVSALDVNASIPGCIATGSTDKQVKIWNTTDNKPNMVTSRNFELGHIFSAKFCPDAPLELAISGSNGKVHVWDMSSNAGVRQVYGQ
ncbi:WD40-repeat-containing domain protein [Zychaea mexicana]|uniref:WD40-repeat-containing domain protein n=1 Tax=Zychaea mexicana TaxID=64656 RepID=UPI0022FEFC9B|nr:WD40-repeat-containing domain protein [Zychaea mexicana]KAI9494356.1 WD40-repeat-containing domain protein [Zychaea mexicana]